jgi:hypothetical protein
MVKEKLWELLSTEKVALPEMHHNCSNNDDDIADEGNVFVILKYLYENH